MLRPPRALLAARRRWRAKPPTQVGWMAVCALGRCLMSPLLRAHTSTQHMASPPLLCAQWLTLWDRSRMRCGAAA